MGLSAVVITLNEDVNIERCLSALNFVDEIVVVDSFSTDRTVELARRYTDLVYQRAFTGYSDQKSAAMSFATQEWVLVLDADEIIPPALAAEILAAITSKDWDGYRIPRLSYFMGKAIRNCGWYPDYQLRLARKAKARFPERLIHETMILDGRCGTLANDMVHYSVRSFDQCSHKIVTYAKSAAQQKMADGARFITTDLVFRPSFAFLRVYILKQGFREGLYGLVLGAVAYCSSVIKYIYLWEMSRLHPKNIGGDN